MNSISKAISISILIGSIASCAWLKTNSAALTSDGLQTIDCVVSAALSGIPVEEIGCGIAAVEDIVKLLDAAHTTPVPSPALSRIRARQLSMKTDAGTQ